MRSSLDAPSGENRRVQLGPQNGTVTVARGTAGPITVLVSVQGWTFDPSTHPTLPATTAITRSVVVALAGA